MLTNAEMNPVLPACSFSCPAAAHGHDELEDELAEVSLYKICRPARLSKMASNFIVKIENHKWE